MQKARRNHIIAALVGNAIGMGMVAFAFRVRWMDAEALDHPFPYFLGFGAFVTFVSTSGLVRTLVGMRRARRPGD